jgi:hypothetical integral membrane protein (TIGR02206 family)
LIAGAGALLCLAARRRPGPWTDSAARALAVVILTAEASWWIFLAFNGRGRWSAASDLPLQLCDVVAFLAPAALWWRRPLLVELTYFWGLGGSVQALLTPDLKEHFPSYPYLQFYLAHGGVVLAALFLVIGLRVAPRRGAVPRVFLITLAFALLAGLADLVAGSNYLYLRQRPLAGSLLDFLGPWPWYLAAGTILALLVLLALDAPFWAARGRQKENARRRAGAPSV